MKRHKQVRNVTSTESESEMKNMIKNINVNQDLKILTIESIIEATLILLNEKPYKRITIKEICVKAGVSRNGFYRNFNAKDEIIRRYLFLVTEQYRQELRKHKNMTYGYLFNALFNHLLSYKSLIKKLVESNLDYLLIDVFFKSFSDFSSSQKFPIYHKCHIAGSIYSIVMHWLMNDQAETINQMTNMVCDLHRLNMNEIMELPVVTPMEKLMKEFQYMK